MYWKCSRCGSINSIDTKICSQCHNKSPYLTHAFSSHLGIDKKKNYFSFASLFYLAYVFLTFIRAISLRNASNIVISSLLVFIGIISLILALLRKQYISLVLLFNGHSLLSFISSVIALNNVKNIYGTATPQFTSSVIAFILSIILLAAMIATDVFIYKEDFKIIKLFLTGISLLLCLQNLYNFAYALLGKAGILTILSYALILGFSLVSLYYIRKAIRKLHKMHDIVDKNALGRAIELYKSKFPNKDIDTAVLTDAESTPKKLEPVKPVIKEEIKQEDIDEVEEDIDDSTYDKLIKLKDLLDKKIITKDEFESKKKEYLKIL